MKNTLSIILCLIGFNTFAQQAGISGHIIGDNGKGVPMVTVQLVEIAKGTQADDNGKFRLDNVAPGNYTLQMSSIGYQTLSKNIQVKTNQNLNLGRIKMQQSTESLDEVVVNGNGHADFLVKQPSTSLRLTTEVLELPQNIQIISNNLIKSQNLVNMMENVTRNVSGAQMIEHWGTFARINMRGFKLPAFRNGLNIELPWGPLAEDMSMVQNIEFVKGPAGFMQSAGEPGGFYNVVTKKPTNQSINEISFTADSFGSYRVSFDSGGALTEDNRLQYRLISMYEDAQTHRDYDESDRFVIAPSLSYDITDKTKVITEFTYQQSNQITGAAYIFAPVEDGFGSLDRNFTFLDKDFPQSKIEEVSILVNATHKFNDKWSVIGQYMFMDYTSTGASAWPASVVGNGEFYRGISVSDAVSTNELGQLYINGEVNTGGIKHKIMGGFDYRHLEYWADWSQAGGGPIDINQPFNIYNPVYGEAVYPVFDRSVSVKVRGAANYQGTIYRSFYLQDEVWMWNDRLRLTLAARYNGAKIFAYGDQSQDEKITPRAGLSFNILPDFTFYALYDQAFTPQYGQSYTKEKFDPLESVDMEGGLKKQWFGGKLNTSLTFYQITKNNYLVSDRENVDENGNDRFLTQTGEVQSKGIEFDMQGQLTPAINVVFNYANTDVEITKDTKEENIGDSVAGHAKHLTNGWVNYGFLPGTALEGFAVSLGYQYQVDRSTWAWGADNEAVLPNYFRMDGGLSWSNDHFRVNLNVNNILDKHLYSGAAYADYLYWQSEPGINGRLTLTYRF
ncbi:TonB-dependent receptor domain-containing protein [Galbibacter sp.]|uniref:TonB-dependent receptor domain-containing protein n=1 Tax=Galbibacter sp. TaxID=2918471 RepID=UPI003A8FAB01